MSDRIKIPEYEYKERIIRAAKLVAERGLDVMIVNGSEADYGDIRYLSGFWPMFERAGIAITASGKCCIMVGPESELFAGLFGKIEKIFVLREYREAANPSYPEFQPQTYSDVFKWLGLTGKRLKIGIAPALNTNVVEYTGLREAFPESEFSFCDDIMTTLRRVKSDNEIACLREAARITMLAMDEVKKSVRPGISELALVGIAQKVIYENGAEYEGIPMFILSGESTRFAISRPTHKIIQQGDFMQINLSAKVDGYSPSIGMPVSIGPMTGLIRELVEFGLKVHRWTEENLKAGVLASDVAKSFYKQFIDNGYADNYLYGPCHGLGLAEVEAPWMETDSNYLLEKNMTFEIDTFLLGKDFGLRWEKPVAIGDDRCILLSDQIGEIIEF